MAIHSRELIDEHLKKNSGFWKGIWLMVKLALRFIATLGPQNWSLSRLASLEQKVEPVDTKIGIEERLEAKVLK